MSNWPNADVAWSARFAEDLKRANRFAKADGVKYKIRKVKLSSFLNERMARAVQRNPNTLVGLFVLPTKTLKRAGRGNTWIGRQEFNITPARPMGVMPSGSRGVIAYPAK
jgi:hypothetical protein